MKTLYEIGSALIELNDLCEEIEGDLSRAGELSAAIEAYMASLEDQQAEKLDNYVGLIRQLEAEAVAARAEAEQWQQKARRRERRAQWLLENLQKHLDRTGQDRVRTASGREIAVVKNGGEQPLVIDPNATIDCNMDFVYPTYHWDKTAIREALAAGRELPFARLGERGRHLRIK